MRNTTLGFQTGDMVRPLLGDGSRRGRVVARHGGGTRRVFRVQWADGSTSWLHESDLTPTELTNP